MALEECRPLIFDVYRPVGPNGAACSTDDDNLGVLYGTASSYGTNNGNYDPASQLMPADPELAIDGNDLTQSQKAGGVVGAALYGAHWEYDLGEERTIFYIDWYAGEATSGLTGVEWSDDGTIDGTWNDAGLGQDGANWVAVPGEPETRRYSLPTPITARYWRVDSFFYNPVGLAYWDEIHVAEFRIMGCTPQIAGLEYLGTLCDAFNQWIRPEMRGVGSGGFSISRYSPNATAAMLGDGALESRYIKVRIPEWWGETPRFGFWLDDGDFTLLDASDEEGAENLTFVGKGGLNYLSRAVMNVESYLSTTTINGQTSPYSHGTRDTDDQWLLSVLGPSPGASATNGGCGSSPAIFWRVIRETAEPDAPNAPRLPLLGWDFDWEEDSNGVTWPCDVAALAEFTANVGEDILSVGARIVATGAMDLVMDYDTFILHAYVGGTYGVDRTSGSFGAGKVRLVAGVGIADSLKRRRHASVAATHAWALGEGRAAGLSEIADADDYHPREVAITSTAAEVTTLEGEAAVELANRLRRGEEVTVSIAVPPEGVDLADAALAGRYVPGPVGTAGHVWVGDRITIHTGTSDFDFEEFESEVAALSIAEDTVPDAATVHASDLRVSLQLGSTATDFGTQQGPGSGGTAGGGTSVLPGGGGSGGGSSAPTIDSWKQPVRVATTANITIATALNAGDSIDGVTLVAGDRVLVKDQSTGSQNGLYLVGPIPTRTADADSGPEVLGLLVHVLAGTVNGGKVFRLTNTTEPTIGSTTLTFAEYASGVTDHGALTGLGDDDHTQYELTTEGGLGKVFAHGSMGSTEALDPSDGNVHTGTLNADCTLTIAAPPTTRGAVTAASTLELWITQDGTGGWDLTIDATGGTVTDDGTITPDTTAGVTVRYILERVPGTTNDWIRNLVGGSGGTALTVEDEGTPLTTAATTLDFVGAGVTATGAGAEKTITIPGVTEATVRDVGHWEVIVSGTAPPVAVSNPADDDWLYGWVSG